MSVVCGVQLFVRVKPPQLSAPPQPGLCAQGSAAGGAVALPSASLVQGWCQWLPKAWLVLKAHRLKGTDRYSNGETMQWSKQARALWAPERVKGMLSYYSP